MYIPLLEQIRMVLQELRTMPNCAQVLAFLVLLLAVIGIFSFFVLAALEPNAYIGISALLSTIGSFSIGRMTKR